MRKQANSDLESLNQSLLKLNQKTIKKINKLTYDSTLQKSENKLRKTITNIFGR